MIPKEFLYVNPDQKRRAKIEEKYGKKYEELDVELDKIEDSDLIQLLGASKYLLQLRGFKSVMYNIKEANENYSAVNCIIKFIGNIESNMEDIEFSDNACAHLNNTVGFGQRYLLEMSTNRSFARCVRNALGINVVSNIEISSNNTFEDDTPKSQTLLQPSEILSKLLNDKKISLQDAIKGMKDSDSWQEIKDIPKNRVFELIGKLKLNK